MKRSLLILAALSLCMTSLAQTHWYNPIESGAEINGQGWPELRGTYFRLPDKAHGVVREDVWGLSRSAAGLSISFYSNTDKMTIRYQVNSGYGMFHMPSTGKSGVDLYATDHEGNLRWCAEDFTPSFGDTIVYRYSNISYPKGKKEYEYRLYLPTYNTVKWLEIGVPEDASITFHKESQEKPIVVYGTSIAQGACSSRPGMAWTNIIQRELGHPVVNLAFSGNGKLEPEVFDLLAEIDAGVYIIDCLPNMGPDKPVTQLTIDGVHKLRAANNSPIILVEHCGHPAELADNSRSHFHKTDSLQRAAFDALKAEGVKDLYYITTEQIGMDIDCMVEDVHPSDLGMRHYADAIEPVLREIYGETECGIFTPRTQNRDSYNWLTRHEEELAVNAQKKPQIVLIGDSITHFWGGDPAYRICRGQDSWDKLWKDKRVNNLGFGWDRIENGLWRISHGELDGYEAEKVFLLLGTNNFATNSDDEIVEGIKILVKKVREHQPTAQIYVCGILPRAGKEEEVASINAKVKATLEDAKYIDMSKLVTDKDGKIIKELFSDGLHPTTEGYQKFAEMIRKGMK